MEEMAQRNERVGFLIGGTQKGGTTALDEYMRGHPSVQMAERKEVHFFDNEQYFRGGLPDYAIYHAEFTSDFVGKRLFGEATPIYMYRESAPQRIWQYNPQMKWILLLRNPIERAYSHWNMERNRGAEALPFFDAIKQEHTRCKAAAPLQHRVYSYVGRGRYAEQIRRLWQFFPPSQTLFVKSESLHCQPTETLRRITDFLEISAFPSATKREVHLGEYAAPLSDVERAYLQEQLSADIREVEQLLDWDCSDWC